MIQKIPTTDLKAGLIAAEPVKTPLGQILVPAGKALSRQDINRMKLYHVESAQIEIK